MESSVTAAALAARVLRLEGIARRDRTIALGLLVLLVAAAQRPAPAAMTPLVVRDASGASATLQADSLKVRDSSHVVRADISIDGDGYPSADLFAADGTIRQSVYLLKDDPVLRQFDEKGTPRAELWLGQGSATPALRFHDASGTERLALFQGTSGNPEFDLFGSDGKVRAYLEADENVPWLVMRDGHAATRVALGAYASGSIGIDVRDSSGTALFRKP